MVELSVATFNMRWGVDTRGHAIDLVGVLKQLDADVVVLQEDWHPDGGPGTGEGLASLLGYQYLDLPLARGTQKFAGAPRPLPHGFRRPRPGVLEGQHCYDLGGRQDAARGSDGTWGIAVLSRLSLFGHRAIDLGRLVSDPAHRAALIVELDIGDGTFAVIGTHLSHLSRGSLIHLRRLASQLPGPERPAALVGDMNMWGPLVSAFLPKWRRAVLGRTWPASHPHHQIDHILVTPAVEVVAGEVLGDVGSDHRPVRARLRPR